MKKITTNECINDVKLEFDKKLSSMLFVVILAAITLYFQEPNKTEIKWIIAIGLILFGFISCFIFSTIKKIKILKQNDFYIIKDKLSKIDIAHGRKYAGGKLFIVLHFQCNGKYRTFLSKQNKISDQKLIEEVYGKNGDIFYVVVCNNEIINCFNTEHYTVSEDEFRLIDGKYLKITGN